MAILSDSIFHRSGPAASRAGSRSQPSRSPPAAPPRIPHCYRPPTSPYLRRLPVPNHQPPRGLLPPSTCRPWRGTTTRLPRTLQDRWTPPPHYGLGPRWTPPTSRALGPPQLPPTVLPHHTLPTTLTAPLPVVIDLTGPDPNKFTNTPGPLPRSRAPRVYRKVFRDPGSKGLPLPSARGFAYLGPPLPVQPLFWPNIP